MGGKYIQASLAGNRGALGADLSIKIICYFLLTCNSRAMYIHETRFCIKQLADVAQLIEQLICNQLVGGLSPSIGSMDKLGRCPSG